MKIGMLSKTKKTPETRSNREKESAWTTITDKFNADESNNQTIKRMLEKPKNKGKKTKQKTEAGHFPHRGWLCCTVQLQKIKRSKKLS